MNENMTAQDAIAIMREHISRRETLMQQADLDGDYQNAQSYKDMAYGAKALSWKLRTNFTRRAEQ